MERFSRGIVKCRYIILLVAIVLPAVICPLVNELCRKLGWVRDGDLTI